MRNFYEQNLQIKIRFNFQLLNRFMCLLNITHLKTYFCTNFLFFLPMWEKCLIRPCQECLSFRLVICLRTMFYPLPHVREVLSIFFFIVRIIWKFVKTSWAYSSLVCDVDFASNSYRNRLNQAYLYTFTEIQNTQKI